MRVIDTYLARYDYEVKVAVEKLNKIKDSYGLRKSLKSEMAIIIWMNGSFESLPVIDFVDFYS